MSRRISSFQSIRTEGGLLPSDLLRRIVDPNSKLPGMTSSAYGLPSGERLNDAITQSWTRLGRHWTEFKLAAAALADDQPTTGITNDKISLPLLRELGFGFLPTQAGPTIDGRRYAIDRFFHSTPIHLVGCGLSLDRRAAGVRGAAAGNPHGIVQEFLNRSDDHRWGIVCNGRQFRILRDNQALSRQSYVEFDLEAMFDGEIYSDFALLWLVAHATRFMPLTDGQVDSCWLETWAKDAHEQGTRVLTELRGSVERALQDLGQGFFSHHKNADLREGLKNGSISLHDYHRQLLRVVYRLIFLFVTEDRELNGLPVLHPPDSSPEARALYAENYGTGKLRDLAMRIRGSRHGDLWRQFHVILAALSGDTQHDGIRQSLALPALGSFLFSPASTPNLNGSGFAATGQIPVELANEDFLQAIRHLAFTKRDNVLEAVDYKSFGSEELGGIYEGLLGLTPQIEAGGDRFTFAELAGNQRKTSGSYFTPDSLVQCLLDSALDPVVAERLDIAEKLARAEWPTVEKQIADDPIKRTIVHAWLLARCSGKMPADPKTAWNSASPTERRYGLSEQAILTIKVCDLAVGSGHFLVGAGHRLARHLARIRAQAEGESEPSPDRYQHALRDVIGRCLYGVDINPMSVELCKVTLWLEAIEPGKPLTFLDHHIRCGNSLLGATPELLAKGIPDDAFEPIEGDDKAFCRDAKKQNKEEAQQLQLFHGADARPWERQGNLPAAYAELDQMPEDSPAQVHAKEERFIRLMQSSAYLSAEFLHDAWCAAFVWKKRGPRDGGFDYCITNDVLRKIERNPHDCPVWMRNEVKRLKEQYQFFHYHLAFPEVFAHGGFDVNLGNPPWERVKLQEKEWFAAHGRTDIANAANAAARKRLIAQLPTEDPSLHAQFMEAVRQAEGDSHFLRNSGLYPLCGRGDINLYTVFAEKMRTALGPQGRFGAVLPSGIATDDTTKFYFQDVVDNNALISLYDFENREGLFPEVHRSYKFCLITAGRARPPGAAPAEFVFFAHQVEHLRDPDRRFTLTPADIALLNPNTRTCPIFRSSRDAELCKAIYRRIPVLIKEGQPEENPWGVRFTAMFHMSNDSHLFLTEPEDGLLPLYEAKMVHYFDHRWATHTGNDTRDCTEAEKAKPLFSACPRYWVSNAEVESRLQNWNKPWLLGFRSIARSTDARTMIPAIVPRTAASGKLPILIPTYRRPDVAVGLVANLSSIAFDFFVRQKIGGTDIALHYAKQFAILGPASYDTPKSDFIFPRVLELTYTAWDLEGFARDCGWEGPPFRWDEDRRFLLRCELDAAFFHLYLPSTPDGDWKPARVADGAVHDETPEQLSELKKHFPKPRDAVAYIMDTFPIVRRKDEEKHNGDYRTKRVILEIYDAMADSIRTGQPYQTRLDPPPADPRCCHPARSTPSRGTT